MGSVNSTTSAPQRPQQRDDGVARRLIQNLNNPEKGVEHHCFAYAWKVVEGAGGKGIDSAPKDMSARGLPTSALGEMAKNGKLHVGDVIYVNRNPGTDDASTNLNNGPHWFVYMGQGQFADQYGMKRSAEEMDQFVPGRKIDAIFHSFAGSPADPPPGALDNLPSGTSGDTVAGNAGSGVGQRSNLSLPPEGGSGGAPFHDFVADANQRAGNGGFQANVPRAKGPSGPGPSAPVDPPSGNLKQWIEEAVTVLESMGVPADQIDMNAINLIVQHESGGDPNAVNNWDSNAAAGHPSKGLMQTIDSTFNEYAAPGHKDVFNPVDNIVAGVRYAISRYGSLDDVPGVKAVANGGSYVGY